MPNSGTPQPRQADTADFGFGTQIRKSPYFDATLRYGATAFTIYNHTYLPAAYGDNVRDYWSLVTDVTLWDVACQRQVEISGPDAFDFVQFLTPRDMSSCEVGQCQYMALTNQDGGIVNDAILLRVEENLFWLSPGDGVIGGRNPPVGRPIRARRGGPSARPAWSGCARRAGRHRCRWSRPSRHSAGCSPSPPECGRRCR